jgi:leader peptidase (prepilin peptidase)/N-methyltransferase
MSTNNPKRSICFSCEQPIRWQDNLPIVSWFLLKGRCRNCGEPFSVRYSLVELLTALLFVHLFFAVGLVWALPVYLLWTAMQITGSFIDIDHTILPDRITLTGTVLFPLAVLVLNVVGETGGLVVPDWRDAVFGALFASGFIYMIRFLGSAAFGREAMGLGDVKLMAMNGALLGWWRSILVIMGLGPVFALAAVLVVWLLRKFTIERFTEVPFGPFLCLGSYAALFWADEIVYVWLGFEEAQLRWLDHPWRWFGW